MQQTEERGGLPVLRGTRDGVWYELYGPKLSVGIETEEEAWPLVDKLRSAGITVRGFELKRPSLEDLFMEVAQNESADGGGRR